MISSCLGITVKLQHAVESSSGCMIVIIAHTSPVQEKIFHQLICVLSPEIIRNLRKDSVNDQRRIFPLRLHGDHRATRGFVQVFCHPHEVWNAGEMHARPPRPALRRRLVPANLFAISLKKRSHLGESGAGDVRLPSRILEFLTRTHNEMQNPFSSLPCCQRPARGVPEISLMSYLLPL